MTKINPDAAAMQQLQSRGVTEQTGVYGEHQVQIGSGKPIRLDSIKRSSIPFQGFTTVTKQERGLAGLDKCVSSTLKILTRPDGKLDAKALLSSVKTAAEYEQRLSKLDSQKVYADQYTGLDREYSSIISELQARYPSAPDSEKGKITEQIAKTIDEYDAKKEYLKNLVQKDIEQASLIPVKNLSNSELAAIYQTFNSGQMDVLQTALMIEGRNNPEAKDARAIASSLFDLQAQILKEVSDRALVGMLEDQIAEADANGDKKTVQELQNRLSQMEIASRVESRGDMSSANLRTLVETAAQSAASREKTALEQANRLEARKLSSVSVSQMADVMRQSELTINIKPETLFADGGVIDDPDSPMVNIFHLANRGIKPKGDAYLAERDAAERLLYPELSGHDVRADERPVYAALNVSHNVTGAASRGYGSAVIVLKPEVAQRATYIANDTFFAPAAAITPERRQNFYNLLDGAGLPDNLAVRCRDTASAEHQALENWLDKIAQMQGATIAQFTSFPNELGLKGEDQKSLFKAVLVKSFGDAQQTRSIMATHDNLEALIPHMSDYDGNSLARAALEAVQGDDPKVVLNGAKYIEAQIQGPVVPSRDIAEIRIIADYEEPLSGEQMNRLRSFEKLTGIKVTILGSSGEPISDWDDVNQSDVSEAQDEFNLIHRDQGRIDEITEDYLKNFDQRLRDFIGNEPNFGDVADELNLGGNALANCKNLFYEQVRDRGSNPKASEDPQFLVQQAFNAVVSPVLSKKAELIRHVKTLQFENPQAQRPVFVKWVCDSKALTLVDEINLVHQLASMQADFLRQVYESDPPMSNEKMIMGMTEAARQAAPRLEEVIAKLNKPDYGLDDKINQLDRISFMSETLLRTADPPMTEEQLITIYNRINSKEMKTLRAQMSVIGQLAGDNYDIKDKDTLNTVILLWYANAMNIGSQAGVKLSEQELQGAEYSADLSMLGKEVRSIVLSIAPSVAEALDRGHPPYETFPAAADPSKMPDSEGRRSFLIRHLDTYMEHERTFDRNFTHGRGHVVRAFIYGAVMCSILEEMGISMDRNAVLCGITQHDSGRQGNGSDRWEADSADNAVTAMQKDFGRDTLGENYEDELRKCIVGHQGKTVEAMLLNAADSLDIGRTQEFDPSRFTFLLEKDGKIASSKARAVRAQLIAEADLLQRLTNPSCSWRNALNNLQKAAFEDAELAGVYMEQKRLLDDNIRQTFEKEWEISSQDYVKQYENIIADNPQIFPLFSRYYRP